MWRGSDPPEDTDNPGPAWRDSRDSQGSDAGVYVEQLDDREDQERRRLRSMINEF